MTRTCFLTTWLLTLLILPGAAWARGAAINEDGAAPNGNAMLDIVSPATGDGKGLLVPRVTQDQRTSADAALDGGLLNDSGQLRGGAAQGLLVYQTNGTQGFYYNTSTSATPVWIFLSTIADNNGTIVGYGAVGSDAGAALGYRANASYYGTALGYQANACNYGAALGYQANGYDSDVAMGYRANGFVGTGPYSGNVAIGNSANAYQGEAAYRAGVAVGYRANARHDTEDNCLDYSCEYGYEISGSSYWFADHSLSATTVGGYANGYRNGTAVGHSSEAFNEGTVVGTQASAYDQGVSVGFASNGVGYGTAIGYRANSGGIYNYAVAKGSWSQCTRYNEEWKTSDGQDNKFGYGQVNWYGTTTDGASTEIYLGGNAGSKFVLQDNSTVTFTVLVTAVNENTGDSSGWRLSGVVKRRSGVGTTAIVGAVSVDNAFEEGGLTTDPVVDADTTYGALQLQVTGVAANTVRWNAAMSYSEARQ